MAEEIEGQNGGAEASGAGADPAAVALALGAADREEANAYLRDQRKLIQLQAKELAHELSLRHWSLWVRHASGLLKLALELSAGLLLLFAVTAIGVTVWNAAHADGLVIEEFSVPADMASRGLTGQVVSTQMLDKLTNMQNLTRSVRAPETYANNWGDDLKVEIPYAGISIGEAYRFLRGWLGHETQISGEVFRTATGIAITARIGGDSGATFAGAESDLDALEQKAAEQLFGTSQPYRYGVYLNSQGRLSESASVFQALARTGAPSERAWAYNGLGVPADCDQCLRARARIAALRGDYARADWWFDRAVKNGPSIPFADESWGQTLLDRGKPDDAIAKFKLANQKGPHFADPLEAWGEALMAKNQSHLALTKFEEADKYAPNWGRLHLKWGEALLYAGRKNEAQKQFAQAAGFDLSAADKAELSRVTGHG